MPPGQLERDSSVPTVTESACQSPQDAVFPHKCRDDNLPELSNRQSELSIVHSQLPVTTHLSKITECSTKRWAGLASKKAQARRSRHSDADRYSLSSILIRWTLNRAISDLEILINSEETVHSYLFHPGTGNIFSRMLTWIRGVDGVNKLFSLVRPVQGSIPMAQASPYLRG